MYSNWRKTFIIIVALLVIGAGFYWRQPLAFAQNFSSSNFTVTAPVISTPGGYSTSGSYRLYTAIQQISIGTSSFTTFGDNSGFLYYPAVNAPVITATAGNAQVVLAWTASTGALGWTVSGYNVGQSTVSGGPYSYTEVGNVLTRTATGLTNSTAYYFVVRPEDAFGASIATSSEASATPSAGGGGNEGGGAGGGGGNGSPNPSPQPLIEQIIRFIFGEAPTPVLPPIAGCEDRRSDFNCDTRVNLRDLSILFSRPAEITGKTLSFLFSDWTDALPIPRRDNVGVGATDFAQTLHPAPPAFAEVPTLLAPQPTAPRMPPAQGILATLLRIIIILLLLIVIAIILLRLRRRR